MGVLLGLVITWFHLVPLTGMAITSFLQMSMGFLPSIIDWLKSQELVMFGFVAGGIGMGMDALVIAPANAGFFALSLAMLQGIIPYEEIAAHFIPRTIIYVAPPFRHTHFSGKQIVVHNRTDGLHELFSYNLYPGPSAKKGIYGVLIGLGEREGWVTAHCSSRSA